MPKASVARVGGEREMKQSRRLREEKRGTPRGELFRQIWDLAQAGPFPDIPLVSRAAIPYLTEPWYC